MKITKFNSNASRTIETYFKDNNGRTSRKEFLKINLSAEAEDENLSLEEGNKILTADLRNKVDAQLKEWYLSIKK